jgi:hypothetical protein
MAVPKKRGTKSKRDKRRLHLVLKEPSLTKCLKCGVAGFYVYLIQFVILVVIIREEK